MQPEVHAAGKVYPGVQHGAVITFYSAIQLFSSAAPFIILLVPVVLADMPLSFICDTICLPYDLGHLGYEAKVVWYGHATYWVVKTDKAGKRHGKCAFQLKTKAGTIWGFVNYEHGLRQGLAKVHGEPWRNGDVCGQFLQDKEWDGSFLLHADDPSRREVGPVVRYEKGMLVGTSDGVFKLVE